MQHMKNHNDPASDDHIKNMESFFYLFPPLMQNHDYESQWFSPAIVILQPNGRNNKGQDIHLMH